MASYRNWIYPDIPDDIVQLLFESNKELAIVGVIGKSAGPDCNKMVGIGILDKPALAIDHKPEDGQIQFYYKPGESILFLHFETPYDNAIMQECMSKNEINFFQFEHCMRCRFARSLLFIFHVCHIVVYVELSTHFDPQLSRLLRELKVIREGYLLKFLPRFLRNTTQAGSVVGKFGRFCAPRLLFLFENYPKGYDRSKNALLKLEYSTEDTIYAMLRREGIVTNNTNTSLVSIPKNKQFVYFNPNTEIRADVLEKSITVFKDFMKKGPGVKTIGDIFDLSPYKGYARPFYPNEYKSKVKLDNEKTFLQQHNFMNFLQQHVTEALNGGFEECTSKLKRQIIFQMDPVKTWYEIFKIVRKIIIENPSNENFVPNDCDYRSYLKGFNLKLDANGKFFKVCCDNALKCGYIAYTEKAPLFYNSNTHEILLSEAISVFKRFARGPLVTETKIELMKKCQEFWENRRQQCEKLSLRGNHCVRPKHMEHDEGEHSSGEIFISTCNCGRTQGRRDDPYTIKQANYDFYEFMASVCNFCLKAKRIQFNIFEPSSNDYHAIEFDASFPKLKNTDYDSVSLPDCEEFAYGVNECSQPVICSFGADFTPSPNLESECSTDDDSRSSSTKQTNAFQLSDQPLTQADDELTDLLDLSFTTDMSVHKVGGQVSTTEYLPGLIHTLSDDGVLPLFPSWSIVCVGASSSYSHNVGLMEHFQSGFLSGANFLLPWDVPMRLQYMHDTLKKSNMKRFRRKGDLVVLKVFVGFEYECSRGHRFFMRESDKVLRGGADIARDSGSKAVNSDMPLYFPCPCRTQHFDVAQLMRVHVVTPKAPVNVIVDPKVRIGHRFIFHLGLTVAPSLSQSAYWILRFPYVYQGDDIIIRPPKEINTIDAMEHGCLLAGMFRVKEVNPDYEY